MSPTRRQFFKGAAALAAPFALPTIGLAATEPARPTDVPRDTHLAACGIAGSLTAFFADRRSPEEAARCLINEGRADRAAVREIALWYASALGHLA